MLEAIDEGYNQYCRVLGHEDLVTKIAEEYGKRMSRDIQPMTEVLIT